VQTLREEPNLGSGGAAFRKGLVIFQFTVSIALITGAIVIRSQMEYIRHKNLGYDRENLLWFTIANPENNLSLQYGRLKRELLENDGVVAVSATQVLPIYECPSAPLQSWEGSDDSYEIRMHQFGVGYDFLDTFKIDLLAGRFFSPEYLMDSLNVVVNEEAVRQMQMKNPVGKTIVTYEGKRTIIGVVRDFHYDTIRNPINPLALSFGEFTSPHVFMRIRADSVDRTIDYIRSVWNELDPIAKFQPRFMKTTLDNLYMQERRASAVLLYFSIFAIFISCLGLFGLSLFMIKKRTKEIGVRKVLGSSVPQLAILLSADFMKWAFFAIVLSTPLSWLALRQWLRNFAFRIELSPVYFIASAAIALFIALITIGAQTAKASMQNPVDALRYE